MYGVVAGITAFGGVSALATTAAHADSTFTFTRIGGADRYATAGLFTAGAFPGGATTVYLADGLTGHQSDALAASGWGGVNNYGALLTDNTNTVPANTTSALSNNKVKNVVILGGTNAISQAQQTALTGAGYTVTRIAGASRLDTMQALDDSIAPASVGKDSAGNQTAFLASGDDNHLVDALSSGGMAYGMKFPVILTSSSSSTLAPQAQQVITALGIKHLVVVGGTAAVPSSQYTPAPAGVTKVDVEAGADRSETSKVLSDFGIAQTPPWAKNSKMELARGDDGADALASAPYSGITDALSTCVTLTPSNPGSCPAFAQEHAATLKGTSVIAGLQAAVTDAAANQVLASGGNSGGLTAGNVSVIQSSAAQGGTINGSVTSPGSVSSLTVTGCGFSSTNVPFDSGTGNFTLTVPATASTGACNLVFTATKTAAAGGGTQTTTVPFTVNPSGASGACSTGPSGATQPSGTETPLPQLCSGKILATNVAGNPSGLPPGTIVQYVMSQKLTGDTLTASAFHVFDASNNRYDGVSVSIDSSNANAADVFYNEAAATANPTNTGGGGGANLTTTTGAGTLTLATVSGPGDLTGPAVLAPAGGSPDGATAIGSSTSTNAAAAGVTAAPNAESWALVGAASTTAPYPNSTALSITFDKAAFVQNPVSCGPTAGAGATPGCGANYPTQYPGGGVPAANPIPAANTIEGSLGFDIVLAATATGVPAAGSTASEIQCYGPSTTNLPGGAGYTNSGGTVPGGNGSTTITIVCPNSPSGPGATASTLTAAAISRVIVQADAVGTVAPSTAACLGAPSSGTPGSSAGVLTGPNGATGQVCNPLQAADAARTNSDSPDLTNVQVFPGTGATADQIVYTFDEPVGTSTVGPAPGGNSYAATIGKFMFYLANGYQYTCAAPGAAQSPANNGSPTPAAGTGLAPCTATVNASNFNQVVVAVGTAAAGTGAGATLNVTGASVAAGAVTGAAGTAGHANADDEFGGANPNNAGTTQTPGSDNAPQLLSVHVFATTNPVSGAVTESATYTFNGPLAGAGGAAPIAKFHLYASDGTFMTVTGAGTCTVGASFTSTPSSSTVTCTGYTITSSPTGAAGTPSNSTIASATLGTVDYAAVTGNATIASGAANPAAGNVNPEGGVKTS